MNNVFMGCVSSLRDKILKNKFLILTAIAVISAGFFAQSAFAIAESTLLSIAVTTPPTNVNYTVGESLDLTGLVVTGTCINGDEDVGPLVCPNEGIETITIDNVTGFDKSTVGTQTLTVTVDEKTATFDVNVIAAPAPVTPPAPAVSHSRGGGFFVAPVTGSVLGASTSTVPVTGSVLGASTFQFTSYLRLGMSSDAVTQLQERLRAEGFFTFPTSTGYFGPITLAAVKAYQSAHGIPATGFVGPLTIAELNATSVVIVGASCPNGNTLASNCTLAPNAVAALVCPNGKTFASNCTSK